MKKHLIQTLFLLALVACNSNPYPSDGLISDKPERDRRPVLSVLSIAVEGTLNFSEGSQGRYPVILNVPKGDPVFEIEGLPEGASFDGEKSEIVWTPGFTEANDVNNPAVKSRDYLVGLRLRSSVDSSSSVTKNVTLRVADTPRSFQLSGIAASYKLKEGEESELVKFRLKTEDFPNGPFTVSLSGSEPHLKLVPGGDPGEWILKAGPFPFDFLKAPSASGRTIKDKIIAFAPDGRKAEASFELKLSDVRRPPALVLPRSLSVTGDLHLAFGALDPNGEIAPKVSVSGAPAVGEFSIAEIANKENAFESRFSMVWKNIPQEVTGRSFDVVLRVCNSSAYSLNHSNCHSEAITLRVEAREVAVPEINRSNWKPEEMKYLLLNQKHTIRMDVRPGGQSTIMSTRASSSDAADKIDHRFGSLEILAKRSGIKVATLHAVNSVGGASFESFLYEALPEDWSSNLVIGRTGANPELEGLEAMLKNSNRDFYGSQGRGARPLAYRNQAFMGTHSLLLGEAKEEVAFFSEHLKNVVISTPRLDLLPETIIAELQANAVYLAGRSSQLPDFKLADYLLTAGKGMGNPSGVSGLKGKTTTESADPAFLTVTGASECAKLFYLLKPGPIPQELTLGVSCRRAGGGRLVVLGFEWADMVLSQPDSGLPALWFKRMMEL